MTADAITGAITSAWGIATDGVSNFLTLVSGNALLSLMCVGLPLCGIGIRFFKRLISARA